MNDFSIQKNTLGNDLEQDLEGDDSKVNKSGIMPSEISRMLLIVQKNSINSYKKECLNLEKQGKIEHLVADANYRSTLTGKDSNIDHEEKFIR